MNFTDKEILKMDGKDALKWWKINKPVLFGIINSLEKGEYKLTNLNN